MTRIGMVAILAASISGASFVATAQQEGGGAHAGQMPSQQMPGEAGVSFGYSEFPGYLAGHSDPDSQESETLYMPFGGCNGQCGEGCGAADCLPIKTFGILPTTLCDPPCDFSGLAAAAMTVRTAPSTRTADMHPRIQRMGDKGLRVSGVSHFIVVRLPTRKGAKRTSTFSTTEIEKPEDWNVEAKEGTLTLVFLPAFKLVNRRWIPIEPKDIPKPPRHLRLVKLERSNVQWKSQ